MNPNAGNIFENLLCFLVQSQPIQHKNIMYFIAIGGENASITEA
jgi:hypothetical protein